MRVTTKIVMDKDYNVLEHKYFEYVGPVAECVRSLVNQATAAGNNAASTAAGLGATAASEGATLNPFLNQEMRATHGFTPGQSNELLTAAEAGSGGSSSALTGQAGLEATRTRNASGFTKSLDEASRNSAKTAAGASEGIAAQDVMGAKQLNQEGAQGMQGLYGTNVSGQLGAMGQQAQDINAATSANQTGWLQNTLAAANTAASLCPAIGSVILMADGSNKLVEEIVAGDKVMGIDGEACTVEDVPAEVALIIRVVIDHRVWYKPWTWFSNISITRNSPTHAFALPKGGFTVSAKSTGKKVLTTFGVGKVVSVSKDGTDIVFNILTNGSHTYRADGVWALGVGDAERHIPMEKWAEIGEKLMNVEAH